MTNQPSYEAPGYWQPAFVCAHCTAFAQQSWRHANFEGLSEATGIAVAKCAVCQQSTIWYQKTLVYPSGVRVSVPNPDMNEDITRDFVEASDVLDRSPRSAAALLRLCIQKLCVQLGLKGKDLNADIGELVRRGLSVGVQQSLDVARVIGNNAVHPGTIDLSDNRETALALFTLVNLIADRLISEPKRVAALYESLPKTALEGIQKRDAAPGQTANNSASLAAGQEGQ